MSYRVIIIGSKGPELLGTFEDKGQCRRVWATAKKGAAIATEAGVVLEHKSGTPRSVEGALERFALQLARELAPRADELVTARVKLVENTERELARERDRLRASEALAARLRSVGA